MSKIKLILVSIFVIAGVLGIYAFMSKGGDISTGKDKSLNNLSGGSIDKEYRNLKLVYSEEVEEVAFLLDFINEKGIFNKHGLNVEQVPTGKATDALAAGEADVQISGPTGPLSIFLGGGELKLLADVFNKFNNFGVSRFPEEKRSEIKKVAIKSFGKEPQIAMIVALKSLGIDTDKVEFVAVPAISARLDMMEKGNIDFMNIQSQKTMLEIGDRANRYYVIDPPEMQKGTYSSHVSIMTNKNALDNKSGELKDFVLSVQEALSAMSDNPEETKSFIQSKYGFSQDISKGFCDRLWKALENTQFIPDPGQNRSLSDLIKKEFKITDSEANADDFIYPDFAREAVSSGAK
ncbi:MAG: ABC transporter substrate-binding protein [Candidatus Paceibacterota bacterium]|jgi:hypothetical protein